MNKMHFFNTIKKIKLFKIAKFYLKKCFVNLLRAVLLVFFFHYNVISAIINKSP
jgi:hypothetical protein